MKIPFTSPSSLSFFFSTVQKYMSSILQFGIKYPFKLPTQAFARPVNHVLTITDSNHLYLDGGQQIYSFQILHASPTLYLSPSKNLRIRLFLSILRVHAQLQMLHAFSLYSVPVSRDTQVLQHTSQYPKNIHTV